MQILTLFKYFYLQTVRNCRRSNRQAYMYLHFIIVIILYGHKPLPCPFYAVIHYYNYY